MPELVPATKSDSSPHTKWKRRQERLVNVAGVVALTYVGLRIVGKIGGILFRKKGKPAPAARVTISENAPEDSWSVLPTPAPQLPEDLKEVFSCTLPCSVKDFYRWFISGQSEFQKNLHFVLEKREEWQTGPWTAAPSGTLSPGSACNPDDGSYLFSNGRSPFDFVIGPGVSGGFIRHVDFIQPKKPPQSVDAICIGRQQFAVFQDETLVYASVLNMTNIPFKDCFTVNTAWVVRPMPGGLCRFSAYLKVNFVKGCIVGGIVRATTTSSNLAYFKSYAAAAERLIAAGGPGPQQLRQASSASGAKAAAGRGAKWAPAWNGAAGRGSDAGELSDQSTRVMRVWSGFVFLLVIAGFAGQMALMNTSS